MSYFEVSQALNKLKPYNMSLVLLKQALLQNVSYWRKKKLMKQFVYHISSLN